MKANNPFGIQDDGRTAGLLSYFFVLGWSMAFFTFHKNDKTSLSSYQLRQTLLLYISYMVIRYGLLSLLGPSTGTLSIYPIVVVNITFVIFWIIGLNGASKAEQTPIPVFGQLAQAVFPKL